MVNLKIDDVAKECGLTKRTIRYYEEIGLLSPPERSEGGMRLYSNEHVEQLKQIVIARDVLGVSLQEIQEFVVSSNQLLEHRQGYLQADNPQQKKQELLEIEEIIARQLQIMDDKLEKIQSLRQSTELKYQRVKKALSELPED
ncbi:MerR family transcriptional regulator [Paenibacillus roseipurpureus]|uniref:MerR family transcriptional regulator n=1 Tax=Paenibacillus roseopurpureus TaxID=2918901 RepID=A0AA96LTE9_9BACL|nr:MerR family transcriptional regulator [Paenibacillus sp. MBLB1832]WNR45729.1 MerR family transcriptional regulator [Paenibacillus sp. MBLB1832]